MHARLLAEASIFHDLPLRAVTPDLKRALTFRDEDHYGPEVENVLRLWHAAESANAVKDESVSRCLDDVAWLITPSSCAYAFALQGGAVMRYVLDGSKPPAMPFPNLKRVCAIAAAKRHFFVCLPDALLRVSCSPEDGCRIGRHGDGSDVLLSVSDDGAVVAISEHRDRAEIFRFGVSVHYVVRNVLRTDGEFTRALCVSRTGRLVAFIMDKVTLTIVDTKAVRVICKRQFIEHERALIWCASGVHTLVFSPDERTVFYSAWEEFTFAFDARTGAELDTPLDNVGCTYMRFVSKTEVVVGAAAGGRMMRYEMIRKEHAAVLAVFAALQMRCGGPSLALVRFLGRDGDNAAMARVVQCLV